MKLWSKIISILVLICIIIILLNSVVLPFFNSDNYGNDFLFGDNNNVGVVGEEIPEPYLYYYPPSNCMGNGYLKTVNWSYFKQLFQNHFDYLLEYRIGGGEWQNGNEFLGIGLNWNESGFYKINLSFTKPPSPSMDVRFTIGIDMVVLNYVNHSSKYEYWLNYSIPNTDEFYSVFFNWSDLMSIPGLIFNHGIIDDLFWFRFRKNDVPSNDEQVVYIFDPILGYNKIGGASMITDDIITGTNHTMPDTCDGELYYGKAYLKSFFGGTPYPVVKMIVYASDKTLVATSDEVSLSGGNTPQWYNFSFNDETIYASSTYAICVWGGGTPPRTAYVYYDTGTNNVTCRDGEIYDGTPPSPWTPVEYDDTMSISAYIVYNCTEEEGCTENCTISNLKLNGVAFGNNTHDVEDCGYHNFTLDISDCLGDIDYLNISVGGEGYHNVSDGNGTYYANLSQFDCADNLTLYINVSCQDGAYKNHSWYWFEIEPCCVLTVESENPANETDCLDYNQSWINLSFWINSSCDNIIDYVNTSFGTNYSEVFTESEGFYWVNFTLLENLTCNTTYYWYINASDGDGCNNDTVNETFWFRTCNCVECCNANIDNPFPINSSGCYDYNLTYINFTAWINTTCEDPVFPYVNFSFGNDYYNWTNPESGFFYWNLTQLNLNCNTTYTWFINLSKSYNCEFNSTQLWFTTCHCYSCCNISIENPTPINTSCYDYTLDYVDCCAWINSSCGEEYYFPYVNITLVGVGYKNWTSIMEGYICNNFTGLSLDCNTNYTWYINYSVDANCSTGSEMFYFWTCPCQCCNITVENPTPANHTDCLEYNNTYINLSAWINTSCADDNIYYVNFSFGSNYSVSLNETDGFYWVNFTGINLTCETNYTWYINVSTNTTCNITSYFFWFLTCSCPPEENCCLITIENQFPVNSSGCYNFSLTYINFSAWINKTDCGENTILNWVNFSFNNSWYNWTSPDSGFFWWNYTSANLSCGSTYNWTIQLLADYECSENFTINYFITCSCPVGDTPPNVTIILDRLQCPCCINICIDVYDNTSAFMNITIYSNFTGGNVTIYSLVNITNGSYCFYICNFTRYNYTYWMNISVCDGNNTVWNNEYVVMDTFANCNISNRYGLVIRSSSGIIGIMAVFGVIGMIFFVIRRRNMEEE